MINPLHKKYFIYRKNTFLQNYNQQNVQTIISKDLSRSKFNNFLLRFTNNN